MTTATERRTRWTRNFILRGIFRGFLFRRAAFQNPAPSTWLRKFASHRCYHRVHVQYGTSTVHVAVRRSLTDDFSAVWEFFSLPINCFARELSDYRGASHIALTVDEFLRDISRGFCRLSFRFENIGRTWTKSLNVLQLFRIASWQFGEFGAHVRLPVFLPLKF